MAGSSGARDALVELTEVSSQIECAVLVDSSGDVIASTLDSADAVGRIAERASALFSAAETMVATERAPLSQLVAEVDGGAVFVVRSDGGKIVAVTGPDPTSGLVFYDLKVTLRDATAPQPESAGA